ncbi:MAG: hypothetical protein ACP5D6_06435 [Kosmotogaceae bacterium]
MGSHENVEELLREIKELAVTYKQIYPDKTIQIQIKPITYDFIKIGLTAFGAVFEEKPKDEPEKLFGFPLFKNNTLRGRYAIAILEEEEKIWQKI